MPTGKTKFDLPYSLGVSLVVHSPLGSFYLSGLSESKYDVQRDKQLRETMETIRKYSDPHVARMAKADLESSGVLVFLKNENFANTMPMHGSAMTVVELQVEKDDMSKALELLGPDGGNKEVVEKIAHRLNRLFGISLLAGVLSGTFHFFYYGSDLQLIPNSIGIGLIGCVSAILILAIINRVRG